MDDDSFRQGYFPWALTTAFTKVLKSCFFIQPKAGFIQPGKALRRR